MALRHRGIFDRHAPAELQAITKRRDRRERSPVSPSLKYSCVGSLLIFTKGSTTSEGFSGKGNAAGVTWGL